jgi:hypothetical protein
MRSFIIFITQKENEVGRACARHGRGEKSVHGFGGKVRNERDDLEDQGVDGRISEWILRR